MRLAAFFLCLYVLCLHLLFLPCDEIVGEGGFFLATKSQGTVVSLRRNHRDGSFFATKLQGTVASLRRNRRGGWFLCGEIARDGGFLATKSQGTVASLQGTVDEGEIERK